MAKVASFRRISREQQEDEAASSQRPSRPSLVDVSSPLDALAPNEAVPATGSYRMFEGLRTDPAGRYLYSPLRAPLAPGARVGILCDTLHGDPEIGLSYADGIASAAELISSLGFVPVIDEQHARVAPHCERWAGTPRERARHFVRLLEDCHVDAVFPLFGKSGSSAVVTEIFALGYRPARRVVMIGGFSQHTDWALFAASAAGEGFFSHVINATQAAYWRILPSANVQNLRCALQEAVAVEYPGFRLLDSATGRDRRGSLSGPLVGGNLGLLVLSSSEPWMPSLQGALAFCEDYDKHPHELHRQLSRFALEASRAGARAVVVGALTCLKGPAHASMDASIREQARARERQELQSILMDVAQRSHIPVFHHPSIFGHGAMNHPFGIGGRAELRAAADGTFTLRNSLALATPGVP